MLDVIEKLLILQDRDRKIGHLQAELARIEPERQMLKAKATGTQAHLEAAKQRVKELESNRKSLELEVESKKQQIERYANQQLQTRKNEEYRALAHEIETCKKAIFEIENREIELMEQSEAAQKEVARASQAAIEAKKLLDEQVEQLAKREANLKQELTSLDANRGEIAAAVDESARNRYERLVRSKGENVVVGINHGVCGGCHMRLPAQVLVGCRAQQDLVACTNCGRILYFSPDMDVAFVE
jgi:predicted  nucleic acid-binding Zn-ribbon protein